MQNLAHEQAASYPDGTLDERKSRFLIAAYTKSLVQAINYDERYAGTVQFRSNLFWASLLKLRTSTWTSQLSTSRCSFSTASY
jgi:hypothetical protein